jgi:hypothetical protein
MTAEIYSKLAPVIYTTVAASGVFFSPYAPFNFIRAGASGRFAYKRKEDRRKQRARKQQKANS